MKIHGLYCILPELDNEDEYVSFLKKLLKFRPSVVQLRIKNKHDKFFYNVGVKFRKIIPYKKTLFIINDRVDIALLVKSDGVHLGQDDLPPEKIRQFLPKKFIIGFSTHSFQQAKEALKLPVDYISVGPIFPTETKPEYPVVGVEVLRKVKEFVGDKLPVVAIGGINHKNVDLLKEAKPDAIAVVSALKELNHLNIEKLKSIF